MNRRSDTVTLKKDLGRALRQGHPWVYREAIVERRDLRAGALVAIADRRGRELAYGYFDPSGPIAVRVLDLTPVTDAAALVRKRLRDALTLRRSRLDLSRTNAFRWVHGEADRLPGIHADVYADVIAVRFDGQGSRAFYGDLEERLRAVASFPVRKVIDRESRGGSAEEIEVLEYG